MEGECFICRQQLEHAAANVEDTICCHQGVHNGCQEQWCLDHFTCSYCRAPIAPLKPVPDKALQRLRTMEWLLSDQQICFLTVTIVGAGALVNDEDLKSAVRRYLGDSHWTIVEKEETRTGGFTPGRICKVVYVTQAATFDVTLDSQPFMNYKGEGQV